MCAYHCAQLSYAMQHRAVPIIFARILQAIIIAQRRCLLVGRSTPDGAAGQCSHNEQPTPLVALSVSRSRRAGNASSGPSSAKPICIIDATAAADRPTASYRWQSVRGHGTPTNTTGRQPRSRTTAIYTHRYSGPLRGVDPQALISLEF